MIILKGYSRTAGSMETGKVIVDKSTGETVAETLAYDNYVLHYVSDDNSNVKGWYCDNVKANASKLEIIGAKTLDELLGKRVMFSLDMTQKTDANGKARQMVVAIVLVGDVK